MKRALLVPFVALASLASGVAAPLIARAQGGTDPGTAAPPSSAAPIAPPATTVAPTGSVAPPGTTAPPTGTAAPAGEPTTEPPTEPPVDPNGQPDPSAKPDPYAEPTTAAPPPAPAAPKKLKGQGPPPEDPLALPEGLKPEIGSSYLREDVPLGKRSRVGLWPLAYKERLGNVITTALFPFYFERRIFTEEQRLVDRELFAGLYYRRRSPKKDVDAAFPVFFRWREEGNTTTVVPPVLFRDGPKGEWHRWVAPLFFASSQPDGGYFHAPLLLTFSHHNPKRAFSLIGGLGYYDRTDKDVDWGVVPFVFGGSNADKLTSYTLIPPLLTYRRVDRDNGKQTTLIGPVLYKSGPDSTTLDVFPLFFHNREKDSTSTTVLPLFHTSSSKESDLLVTPLFLHSRSDEGRTIVTPLYSQHRGRTTLDLAGPIIPLFAHYRDPDIHRDSWLVGPTWTTYDPTGWSVLTPLFGHWREYGVSRTTWVFPTFHHVSEVDGWAFNIHPLLYLGRDKESSHTVLAPFWFDFKGAKKRTTIGFPLFWRFRDDEGTTQLAANTLYLERPSAKGANWDFYFLPFLHVGEQPNGNAWDFLFGLVGYKREGTYKQLKVFWIPIDLTKNPAEAQQPPPKK